MRTITDHEFVQNPEGDLALVLDLISFDEAEEPVLLVSRHENTAYLRRAKGDVHEILGIDPEIIEAVRGAEFVVIVEMLGPKVTHSYDVPTAILEEDAEAQSSTAH